MADSNDLGLPSLQKLQSAEQMELLDVVDSLRAYGLGDIVALPQLIVCGDQSSGKSSVLEAISGIPFPRQETLCTRFATEVVLRRATNEEIKVSIVPGEGRSQADQDRLKRFSRQLRTKDDFKSLFENATDEMGLSSVGKSFSNDILHVEFCGPLQPQLTLVDLPGLIHSETKSQTAGDVKLVHDLVSRYLQNPRSIILAVVSAKNDIGNQIILNSARKVDPHGLRTLGIITKPDLLVKGSKSEEAFISLARNENVKFSLGWHVVKNIDSAVPQTQPETRDQEETLFFQESGFNCLPAHTVGIIFLRSRLSRVLFTQIRKELPRLVEDIQTRISTAQIARDKLGPSRTEIHEQRSFLISLSQSFQTICRDAVRGDYEHPFFQGDSNPERRLCANVMNMHFSFAKNIRENGATWLVDDTNARGEKYRTREDAIKEACTLLKRSRGRELPGLPNPLLVGELFRQYSRPWETLARLHIKNVWKATNRFLDLLLRHLTDEEVCENIFRFWLGPIMEQKLSLAYGKLDELLEVHKDYPMTTNTHFIKNSRNLPEDSTQTHLESLMKNGSVKPGQDIKIEDLTRMMSKISTKSELDMDMVAAEQAFDNMNAYYEVALNLFTDNVPTLAVQTPIIREVPNIFCPTAVFSMETDVIGKIAGETQEKIDERASVLRRLTILENGADICKRYAKRPPIPSKVSDDLKLSELDDKHGKASDHERITPSPRSSPYHFPVPQEGAIPIPFSHFSLSASSQSGNEPASTSVRSKMGTKAKALSPSTRSRDTRSTKSPRALAVEHSGGESANFSLAVPLPGSVFMPSVASGSPANIPVATVALAGGNNDTNAAEETYTLFGKTYNKLTGEIVTPNPRSDRSSSKSISSFGQTPSAAKDTKPSKSPSTTERLGASSLFGGPLSGGSVGQTANAKAAGGGLFANLGSSNTVGGPSGSSPFGNVSLGAPGGAAVTAKTTAGGLFASLGSSNPSGSPSFGNPTSNASAGEAVHAKTTQGPPLPSNQPANPSVLGNPQNKPSTGSSAPFVWGKGTSSKAADSKK